MKTNLILMCLIAGSTLVAGDKSLSSANNSALAMTVSRMHPAAVSCNNAASEGGAPSNATASMTKEYKLPLHLAGAESTPTVPDLPPLPADAASAPAPIPASTPAPAPARRFPTPPGSVVRSASASPVMSPAKLPPHLAEPPVPVVVTPSVKASSELEVPTVKEFVKMRLPLRTIPNAYGYAMVAVQMPVGANQHERQVVINSARKQKIAEGKRFEDYPADKELTPATPAMQQQEWMHTVPTMPSQQAYQGARPYGGNIPQGVSQRGYSPRALFFPPHPGLVPGRP